jgi:hypothetical protein
MQFSGGKFNQPDDLMRPEVRIHKLSIQCKTASIRETVAYDVGQQPGLINSRGGLVRILHLHVLMNLICEVVHCTSVK